MLNFKKETLVFVAMIAVICLLGFTVLITTRSVPVQPTPEPEQLGGTSHTTSDLVIGQTTNTQTRKNLTVTGTTTLYQYYSAGGIDYANVQVSFPAATSTYLCIQPNPWFGTGTSSLVSFMARITRGVLGANTMSLSTTSASGGYGSSSPAFILDRAVASGAQDNIFWNGNSTTTSTRILPGTDVTTGASLSVIGPSEYVSYRVATGTPGTFATPWAGSCSFTFMKP